MQVGSSKQWIIFLDEQNVILCRGEKLMDLKIEGSLRCRYITRNVPFFFIQPIKMEEASLKPLIVVYHDVISDEEIATVKKLAQPKVQTYAC